ncbi:MAG TPA: Spo0E family sporulation regulatory protein-aspartic acid phosphatase [Bacillota bacterium]|nr:Spo0E family sporulation regulatory protein-aspartic acid phosphatase [Bacillota bacterium]
MEREQILLQIRELKFKMGVLWDERQQTDKEILDLSVEIDVLLNLYYRTPKI